jgi:hypothetical protein
LVVMAQTAKSVALFSEIGITPARLGMNGL